MHEKVSDIKPTTIDGTIKDHWDYCHSHVDANSQWWLSGYSGEQVWTFLQVNDLIKPQCKVLNVGVGTGRCTRDLYGRGADVSVLDISPNAINKVKEITEHQFLADNLFDIPSNYFDLVISHLVAQHMTNIDFQNQAAHLIRSLKRFGIYAVQIATNDIEENNNIENDACVKSGGVCRTPELTIQMINNVGGYYLNIINTRRFKNHQNVAWHGLQFGRDYERK